MQEGIVVCVYVVVLGVDMVFENTSIDIVCLAAGLC